MKEYLLQQLADLAGVSYISDLHDPLCRVKIRLALDQLNPEHYSIREWSDAVGYILSQKPKSFDTPYSAWKFLRGQLERL